MMNGYGWHTMTGSGWGWAGMTVMMLFWLVVLALLVYLVVRAFSGPSRTSSTNVGEQDRALDVLRERFAHGEISEEEYRNVSQTLRDTTG